MLQTSGNIQNIDNDAEKTKHSTNPSLSNKPRMMRKEALDHLSYRVRGIKAIIYFVPAARMSPKRQLLAVDIQK
jgi:hypothetical protein